jgi:hypothetical protein
MQPFNKILIVGDSFCARRDKESDWPIKLSKLLSCELWGYGHPGTSWWSSRNTLLKEPVYDKSTTIRIIVHTETARLPNDFNHAINTGLLFTEPGSDSDELKDYKDLREIAKAFYTSDLFSIEFYTWAQQAWIKELDADTEYYATIHIPAFDSVDLTCVKNGIFVIPGADLRSLRALSDREIGESNWVGRDTRSNHLSDENNINLANALAYIISNLQPGDTGERNFHNLHDWKFEKGSTIIDIISTLDFKIFK